MPRNSRYKETLLKDEKGERIISVKCPISKIDVVVSLTEVELLFDSQDNPYLDTREAFCSSITNTRADSTWQECCPACLVYLDNNYQQAMAESYEN